MSSTSVVVVTWNTTTVLVAVAHGGNDPFTLTLCHDGWYLHTSTAAKYLVRKKRTRDRKRWE